MQVQFGVVDQNGTVRFNHPCINKCRTFLRRSGLEMDTVEIWRGWHGNHRKGMINFVQGQWEAAYWTTEED